MNPANLNRAVGLSIQLAEALREAHTDAVNGGSQCQEAMLFDLIAPSVRLQESVRRAALAVVEDNTSRPTGRDRRKDAARKRPGDTY